MGPRWAHFSRNTVDGHRNVSTSTYAEQNHSSLKAKAPDNPKRKMERNVTDVMKRDRDLIQKRQLDKHRWGSAEAIQRENMTVEQSSCLGLARQQLDEKPFEHLTKEYNLSAQYKVTSEVRAGITGCLVVHCNSHQSEGRFIPDGRRCGQCKESIAMSICRHDIAKKMFQKEPVFNRSEINHALLYFPFIPRMTVSGNWVNEVRKIHKDGTSSTLSLELTAAQSSSAQPTAAQSSSSTTLASSVDFAGTQSSTSDELPSSTSQSLTDESASTGTVAQTNSTSAAVGEFSMSAGPQVLQSPSKDLWAPINRNAEGTSTAILRKSVHYNLFVAAGRDIAELASSCSTVVQHALYNHLQQVKNLVSTGDYSNDRHLVTGVGNLARILSSVSSQANGSMPKHHGQKRPGRQPQHRLGSEKSTASVKRRRTCGFCKMSGCAANSCRLKRSWGIPARVTNDTFAEISEKLGNIADGVEPDFKEVNLGDATSQSCITNLPQGTRRLQVKGYFHFQGNQFIFCTCINAEGKIHSRQEGSEKRSYADVFIPKAALIASFKTPLDYIFWQPGQEEQSAS